VGLYSGGGAYIWNEVSVRICGGLIFGGEAYIRGGLIVGGLKFYFSNSYLQTMFQEPLLAGMLFGTSFFVHSRSSPRIGD
jgi:hypothetical protein